MGESDDDAVLSFLQSMESSDEESDGNRGSNKVYARGNAHKFGDVVQSRSIQVSSDTSACSDAALAGGQSPVTKDVSARSASKSIPQSYNADSRDPKFMVLRGSAHRQHGYGVPMALCGGASKDRENKEEEPTDAQLEGANGIDLASIRAVAKEEASGATLLACLDPV